MKRTLAAALILLPPAAMAAPPPPAPLPDLTTLEYLADWPAEADAPAPDDPLLAAVNTLIETPGDPHDAAKPSP